MKKITNLTVLAVISAVVFSSCSIHRTNTVKTMGIVNTGVIQKTVIADLDIQQTKAKGTASDKTNVLGGIEAIKNEAVKDVLSRSGDADVLIEPNFTVTTKGSVATVEVTGYPARYKSFRNIEEKDTTWLKNTSDIHKARIYDPSEKSDFTKEQPKKKTGWIIAGSIVGGVLLLFLTIASAM